MEKPHTGLDECPRILLSCLRARNSGLSPSSLSLSLSYFLPWLLETFIPFLRSFRSASRACPLHDAKCVFSETPSPLSPRFPKKLADVTGRQAPPSFATGFALVPSFNDYLFWKGRGGDPINPTKYRESGCGSRDDCGYDDDDMSRLVCLSL